MYHVPALCCLKLLRVWTGNICGKLEKPMGLSKCDRSLTNALSHRCPVSDDLDMMGVARQYVQLELPAFALACLMLMPHSEKRHQQIKVS
jgi:hypothetical protein